MGRFLVVVLALGAAACARGGANGQPQAPIGHMTVQKMDAPEDAPDGAKTIQVEYAFDRDVVNKDFDKTVKDQMSNKGVKVDETLTAHAHFDVKDAKITGTVTYVKKGLHYSIVEADLVATGHYDADVKVDLDVAVKGDSRKMDGFDKTLLGGKPVELVKNVMPVNIPIAGPLFLHAHFDLGAACAMDIEGQTHATTGVGIAGDVRLAAKYKKDGFEKEDGKKSKFQFEAKAPNFELAPKPYLEVQGRNQRVKGRCSLQPTAVLLLEHSVGAKIAVEPYVELDAHRASTRQKWQLDAQAGVSVHAATDVEVFGHQMGKPKEFNLFEIALTKPGDPLGDPPPPAAEPTPAPQDDAKNNDTRVASASMMDGALASAAKPVARKAAPLAGLFGKKKRKN